MAIEDWVEIARDRVGDIGGWRNEPGQPVERHWPRLPQQFREATQTIVAFIATQPSRLDPSYQDPWFTFRFADDRIIPRFHLEGVEAGRHVSVFKIDPRTGERLGLLALATVGEGGWVELAEPIIVRAGDAFIAVPGSAGGQ
jgi:hypothetical protein